MSITKFKENIMEHKEEYLETLFTLVKQPSISSQNIGIEECAELLSNIMDKSGIDTKILQTKGSPVVYGEVINPKNEFTILFYGHYDVQPPEPLDKWITPPFEPTIRDGKIFARGTGDNKGQLLAHVLAVKSLLEMYGELPVNVKFLFEGEEENTSINLRPFVEENLELLSADVVYTADGAMEGNGMPYVMLGNRGMLYVKLTASGATHDNHSGNKGGIAPNPAWNLIHLLNKMYSEEGIVQIEGFYDDIREITDSEKENLRSLPFDPIRTAEVIGLERLDVDVETYYKRITLQPTFNINGLSSGYTGKGQKTIIPSNATVKIDMRLAADQNPEYIFEKVKKFVEEHSSDITIEKMGSVKPSRTPMDLDVVQKIISSIEASYEKKPLVLPAVGATGPMYVFTDIMKRPSVCIPYANADEDNHAPNENMGVEEYFMGIQTSCKVIMDLGK